jgi:hypothetical protein
MLVNGKVNTGERRYQKWLILLINLNLDLVNGNSICTSVHQTPP